MSRGRDGLGPKCPVTLCTVLPWFLRHLVVWFAWKIPNSLMHYLRNIEIKIKTKIKQT